MRALLTLLAVAGARSSDPDIADGLACRDQFDGTNHEQLGFYVHRARRMVRGEESHFARYVNLCVLEPTPDV